MAKKFYAVRAGRTPGIYKTWDDCKRQVTGCKGAEYKGFETLAEEEAYIKGPGADIVTEATPEALIAYVDGSYNIKTKEFAYGVVILDGETEKTFNGKSDNPEIADMRNVAGEIAASEVAMKYCVMKEVKKVTIYHDYAGISKWCTGEWKTNKPGTQKYKAYYDSIKNKLDVTFVKVKGHSGDKYNDVADRLAKDALGIK